MKITLLDYSGAKHYVEIPDYTETITGRVVSGEMSDFRVSRSLSHLTIYDVVDDNRAVLACKVSKQTIQCGTMCM